MGWDGVTVYGGGEEREECWGGGEERRLCEWASREGENSPIQKRVVKNANANQCQWPSVPVRERAKEQKRKREREGGSAKLGEYVLGSVGCCRVGGINRASRGKADGFTEKRYM